MKKALFTLVAGLGLVAGGANMAMAQSATAGAAQGFGTNVANNAGITGVAGTDQSASDGLVGAAKAFLNWCLGLLALVAFGFLIFGGFQMVTAGGDENGYKKGFTVLKNAAIGLAFIGLSWLIVTLIFYIVGVAAGGAGATVGT